MMRVRCPACLTTFRIKEAHLHTRSGKVRCGRCYTPFSALENLLYDSPPASQPAERPEPATVKTPSPPPSSRQQEPARPHITPKPAADTSRLFDFDEKLQSSSTEETDPDLPLNQLGFGPSSIRTSPRSNNPLAENKPGPILPSGRAHTPIIDFPSLTENAATHFALREKNSKTPPRATLRPTEKENNAKPSSPLSREETVRSEPYSGTERRSEVRLDLPSPVKNAITLSEQPYRRPTTAERRSDAFEALTEQPAVFKHRQASSAASSAAAGLPHNVTPDTKTVADDIDAIIDRMASPTGLGERRMEPELSIMDLGEEYVEEDDDDFTADDNPYHRNTSSGISRSIWGIVIGTLLGVLIVQGAYLYREDITRIWPQSRPAYLKVCALVGCTLPLPRTAGAINIETSDLESDPEQPNHYVLNALLRNTASYTLQYPYLELSLTDIRNKTLVRRALPPQEWLAEARIEEGIPAGKEISLRLPFAAQGIDNAVGYQIYAFYP